MQTTSTYADEEFPSEYLCPLTLQPFQYLVLSRHGINYERSAILEWLDRGNTTCPLTRKPLTISGLVNNTSLRNKVQLWKSQHGFKDSKQSYGRFTRAGLVIHDNVNFIVKEATPRASSSCTTKCESTGQREKRWVLGRKRKSEGVVWC